MPNPGARPYGLTSAEIRAAQRAGSPLRRGLTPDSPPMDHLKYLRANDPKFAELKQKLRNERGKLDRLRQDAIRQEIEFIEQELHIRAWNSQLSTINPDLPPPPPGFWRP